MLRRGRGKTKAKALKQGLSKKNRIALGFAILVSSLGLLFTFNAQPAHGTDDQRKVNTYQQIKKQRAITHHWRKKAHRWAHRRKAHLRAAHGRLSWLPLNREIQRTVYWKKQTRRQYRKFVAYKQNRKARRSKCLNAGFPRWYCPVLIKAAKHEKRPAWAYDPNLAWIIRHESGFRPHAQNPTSTAYGLFQFLNTTWRGTGIAKTSNPYWQTRAGIRYIKGRYGTPAGAVSFWKRNRWY